MDFELISPVINVKCPICKMRYGKDLGMVNHVVYLTKETCLILNIKYRKPKPSSNQLHFLCLFCSHSWTDDVISKDELAFLKNYDNHNYHSESKSKIKRNNKSKIVECIIM